MDYGRSGSNDLAALVVSGAGGAPGTVIPFVQASTETGSGVVLPVGTYVFLLGTPFALTPAQTALICAQLYWAAAVAATITLETCSWPKFVGNAQVAQSMVDVSDYTNTTGLWLQQNPAAAVVPVAGASNTSTAATVTAGGVAAGGCEFDVGNLGARRARIKVVTTVGGLVRCCVHGKLGG